MGQLVHFKTTQCFTFHLTNFALITFPWMSLHVALKCWMRDKSSLTDFAFVCVLTTNVGFHMDTEIIDWLQFLLTNNTFIAKLLFRNLIRMIFIKLLPLFFRTLSCCLVSLKSRKSFKNLFTKFTCEYLTMMWTVGCKYVRGSKYLMTDFTLVCICTSLDVVFLMHPQNVLAETTASCTYHWTETALISSSLWYTLFIYLHRHLCVVFLMLSHNMLCKATATHAYFWAETTLICFSLWWILSIFLPSNYSGLLLVPLWVLNISTIWNYCCN